MTRAADSPTYTHTAPPVTVTDGTQEPSRIQPPFESEDTGSHPKDLSFDTRAMYLTDANTAVRPRVRMPTLRVMITMSRVHATLVRRRTVLHRRTLTR